MTTDIALVLGILLIAIVLFVMEVFRVDVVALLVLSALVLTGLVTPVEAMSGFSNSAVVTVWAIFILSGGLAQTGVANMIGAQMLRLAGSSFARLLLILMLTAGLLSGFMNNIGVVAMLLPVILDISRRTGHPASRLLLPTVFAALIGGTMTLIGTPANILVSEALVASGLEPFGMFTLTPVGLTLLGVGTLLIMLIGKWLFPTHTPVRDLAKSNGQGRNNRSQYELEERLAVITLPKGTALAGITLAESRLGEALGLTILALSRGAKRVMAPDPAYRLRDGDKLYVLGRLDRLDLLTLQPNLVPADFGIVEAEILEGEAALAELAITPESTLLGRTLTEVGLRRQFGLNVLALMRDEQMHSRFLQNMTATVGDRLLLFGSRSQIMEYLDWPGFRLVDENIIVDYALAACLLAMTVTEDSALAGRSLLESRLANTYGLNALCILRVAGDAPEETIVLPGPDTRVAAGDTLIVTGDPQDLEIVRGLQTLQIDRQPDVDPFTLESESVAFTEAILSPYTTLIGKTLRELRFREKFGLSVLAIWRGSRPYRTDLGNFPLRLGDAMLLFGPRNRINILAREPDFLVLDSDAQEEPNYARAPVASLLMLAVVLTVVAGWLPIAAAAVIGATLMVVTGCLSMDDAYRYIEWQAIFLIAAMLPLGIALEQTGAASWLADQMMSVIGGYGPYVVMAGIFLLALAGAQFMPNPVVAVLLAPIALTAAASAGVSPYPFMVALVVAASSSFLSPIGHAANVLVMGPGGYRFSDYPRAGAPVAFVIMVVTLLLTPVFFPF